MDYHSSDASDDSYEWIEQMQTQEILSFDLLDKRITKNTRKIDNISIQLYSDVQGQMDIVQLVNEMSAKLDRYIKYSDKNMKFKNK